MNHTLGAVAALVSAASFAALLTAVTAGCTATQQVTPAGSDGGADGGAAAPARPGLSCVQILQCVGACVDSDTPCPDACVEKGDVEGKANVIAFATCVDKEKCADAACIQAKCATSLNVCVTSSAPKVGGTPLQGAAPPGSVPADLVGTWAGARDGTTERLIFNADGSGTWESAVVSQQSACANSNTTTRKGNIVISDSTITVYATSIVLTDQRCAPPAATTNKPGATEGMKWHRPDGAPDPNTIFIVNNECAAKFPGQESCDSFTCAINLYCTARLHRQ